MIGKDVVWLQILEIAANRNQCFEFKQKDKQKNHKFLPNLECCCTKRKTRVSFFVVQIFIYKEQGNLILIDTIEEVGSHDRKIRIAGLFNGIHSSEDIYSGY